MCLSWKGKYVYIFPPFSMLSTVVERLQKDQTRALVIIPTVENPRLVSKDESDVNQPASTSAEGGIPSSGNTRLDQSVPSMAQTSTDGMLLVRARLRH